jgi:hypothetical protein
MFSVFLYRWRSQESKKESKAYDSGVYIDFYNHWVVCGPVTLFCIFLGVLIICLEAHIVWGHF